ncbi:MAG: hypothetical protein ABSD96_15295 [Candidatus Korobacteraceae bacterium]|jgi:hypothetical protein
MKEAEKYGVPDERPLRTEERGLLEWLIAHGSPNAEKYASQLPRVTVASRCTCGCPTIVLAVDGETTVGVSEIIADAEGYTPDAVRVGVILHCRASKLSELEVYAIDPIKRAFGLPHPDALVAFSDMKPE